MRESSTRFSLACKSLKTGYHSYLRSLLFGGTVCQHIAHHVTTSLTLNSPVSQNWLPFLPTFSSFIPIISFYSIFSLSRPSVASRLKSASISFFHFVPVWWSSLPVHCSSRHSFTFIKLTCLWSFNLPFSKKVKNPSFSLFFFLGHLYRLSQYWPSFVVPSHPHFIIANLFCVMKK